MSFLKHLIRKRHKYSSYRIYIGFCIILLVTNINAIVDSFMHPEIPYFDDEHIIVGLISGLSCFVFFFLSYLYIKRLQKITSQSHTLATELFFAKEKIEENEKRLIEAQKTAHLGHWNWDLLKQELCWSDEIFNIFGVSKENFEVTADNFERTIHPDDLQEFLKIRNNALEKGEEVNISHRIIRPNGEIRYVQELSKIIRNSEDQPICVFGTVQDITEIKLIESELIKAKEKAEESDRLKSAFLANISHEIRTPLNGIIGFSDIISNRELPEKKFNEYVEIIHNCGNQLLTIINDIIDISKIESNQIQIKSQPENLNEIFREMLFLFKDKANNSNIELSYTCGFNDNSCNVLTDGNRLKQILTNLINNSLKFISKGFIKYGYSLKGEMIEFFVEDSGIGISEEMQTKIYDRFMQIENEFSRIVSGTGLGLPISKALVELLGGKMWLNSELGKGTVFYFTIPYKPAISNNQIETKPTEKIINLKEIKILIVEDDYNNYLYLKEILSIMNINILHVSTGIDAINKIKQDSTFDLILMDLKLPVLDGLHATMEIKKINKNIPIIAQTAFAQISDKDKAIEAGCVDYISKPINKAVLRELILKYI